MKVFFVNLARRPERRMFMERQFDALGIDAERVEAVDGRAMAPMEREKAISRFRWWCANGYRARDGEIGCALSHQVIYQRMVVESIPYACILEDDIELVDGFPQILDAAESFLLTKPSPSLLLMAPYPGRRKVETAKPNFVSVSRWASSAGAYVINLAAARAILAVNRPVCAKADDWPRFARVANVALFDANPVVCQQDEYRENTRGLAFASDTIDSDTVFVSDMPPCRRLAHKAMRCIGIVIDRIIR